jgi:uncharacterized membrane protein
MKSGINNKLASRMPAIGCLLVGVSFLMNQLNVNPHACSFLSGIGCAFVGMGVIGILIKRIRPEYSKKLEINQNDERNIQIREKSGYIAYLLTLFVFTALEVVFLMLDNQLAGALTILAMSIHITTFIIAQAYYNRTL